MKFNFLSLLNKDEVSTEQVAREIVLLENKIAEAKIEEDRLVQESHDLRAKQLCGESVNASDLRGVKEKLAEIQVDQAVFSDSLEKLTAKLVYLIEEKNRQDWEQWRSDAKGLWEDDRRHMSELIKYNARISVLKGLLGDCIGRGTLTEDEIKDITMTERKDYLENLVKPTCMEKFAHLASKENELKNFKVQDAVEKLLNQYRNPQEAVV